MAHEHCQGCFLSSCTADYNCPVEYCQRGCGFSFHRCKMAEHDDHTCPEARVGCPYGCKELLARKSVGIHLEHCAASILQCRFSHTRLIASNEAKSVGIPDPINPDRRDTFIDEELLDGDMRLVHKESTEVPPLENTIENCPYTSLVHKYSRAHKMDTRRGRFCHVHPLAPEKYVFCCNEMVRRDEFTHHWSRFHMDIQLHITEVIQRCPFARYGCTFSRENLVPSPSGTILNYDKERDCFLSAPPPPPPLSVSASSGLARLDSVDNEYMASIQKKKELSMYGYGDEEEESYDVLGQLPFEVLLHICGYLDSISLWSMSMVNHYIRKVAFSIVRKKGIVFSKWTKEGSCGSKWIRSPAVRIL